MLIDSLPVPPGAWSTADAHLPLLIDLVTLASGPIGSPDRDKETYRVCLRGSEDNFPGSQFEAESKRRSESKFFFKF